MPTRGYVKNATSIASAEDGVDKVENKLATNIRFNETGMTTAQSIWREEEPEEELGIDWDEVPFTAVCSFGIGWMVKIVDLVRG